jgi:hypothetical protein
MELLKAQAELGNAWTKIAARLSGRSENAAKNRWNSAPIKRLKKKMPDDDSEVGIVLRHFKNVGGGASGG